MVLVNYLSSRGISGVPAARLLQEKGGVLQFPSRTFQPSGRRREHLHPIGGYIFLRATRMLRLLLIAALTLLRTGAAFAPAQAAHLALESQQDRYSSSSKRSRPDQALHMALVDRPMPVDVANARVGVIDSMDTFLRAVELSEERLVVMKAYVPWSVKIAAGLHTLMRS